MTSLTPFAEILKDEKLVAQITSIGSESAAEALVKKKKGPVAMLVEDADPNKKSKKKARKNKPKSKGKTGKANVVKPTG